MRDEITFVCALVVFVLCGLAIWAEVFKDNWLQFAGCGVLGIGAAAVAWHALSTGRANSRELLVLLGIALYGIGTAIKAWRLNREPPWADTVPGDRSTA